MSCFLYLSGGGSGFSASLCTGNGLYFCVYFILMHNKSSERRTATDHVPLLGAALLHPAQLRQRQLSGDGVGQRELVVGAGGPLQLQTCGQTDRQTDAETQQTLTRSSSLSQDAPHL